MYVYLYDLNDLIGECIAKGKVLNYQNDSDWPDSDRAQPIRLMNIIKNFWSSRDAARPEGLRCRKRAEGTPGAASI